VHQAAEELKIPVEHLAVRDEKVTSNWQSVLQSFAYSTSWTYAPPSLNILNDTDFYNVESDIITKIANNAPRLSSGAAVIMSCGNTPDVKYLLHADVKFRQHGLRSVSCFAGTGFEIDEFRRSRTGALSENADRSGLAGCPAISFIARYRLIGMEKSEAIILETFRARFGNVALQTQEGVKV